jgi:hypothetical protein
MDCEDTLKELQQQVQPKRISFTINHEKQIRESVKSIGSSPKTMEIMKPAEDPVIKGFQSVTMDTTD